MPQPDAYGITPPSCSAQTLKNVSSLVRYFAYATYKSLFKFISEGIGGSRETPAYFVFKSLAYCFGGYLLRNPPNPQNKWR